MFVCLTVAGAVFADALVRCAQRTLRLTNVGRELARLSLTDPLTGLSNRRHLEEHLVASLSAARRHCQPLSVLFIDIDSFKRINDQSGYEAGDEVLRVVGDRVSRASRAEDLVGRWGGEEFLAVLPATDLSGAVAAAERIRVAVASEAIWTDGAVITVTVSIGCASGRHDPADLIGQASQALRQAKQAGRNQVVAAPQPAD